MNDDFEQLTRLLALKRYEKPKEGFEEDFLKEFHLRQRREMLKRSSLSLVWDRMVTFFDELSAPAWGAAGAAALVIVASVIWLNPEAKTDLPSSSGLRAAGFEEDKTFVANPIIFGEADKDEVAKQEDEKDPAKKKPKSNEPEPQPVNGVK